MAKEPPAITFPAKGLVSHLATVDQTEVCPLSRGVMSQPLSDPLQTGLRFFRHPIPAQSSASLTVRLPVKLHWQPYRLTTFPACHKTDVGSAYSPAVRWRRNPNLQRVNRPRTFWLMPVSSFGTVLLTRFISSSLPLTVSASLAPQPLCCLESPSKHLTALTRPIHPRATLSEELHTPPLPVTHVFLGYCWSYSRFTILDINGCRVRTMTHRACARIS